MLALFVQCFENIDRFIQNLFTGLLELVQLYNYKQNPLKKNFFCTIYQK